MMFKEYFNDMCFLVKEKINNLFNNFSSTFNFVDLERQIIALFKEQVSKILHNILQELISQKDTIEKLKVIGMKRAMKFKGLREVTIHLITGDSFKILSPYFIKAGTKRGKKKQGPNGRGCHLGLQVFGFLDKYSLNFVDEISQMSILCPSAEIARECLALRGISIQAKTIIKLTKKLGLSGIAKRGQISFSGNEYYEGKTLVIGIDGGRLRERRAKRGRKKQGLKRQGYHSDWKEPKLFALYLLDSVGKVVKDTKPIYDATMKNHEGCFDLLKKYLTQIPLQDLDRIVFCGDGASWIWNDIKDLCQKMNIPETKVHQVIDYTHAKQNLYEMLELLPQNMKNREKVSVQCKNLLFAGKIDRIRQMLTLLIKGKKQEIMLRKWDNYFNKNKTRMQYSTFKTKGIPTGSGFVESAIRRVINMRLKSAGSF